MNKVHTFKNNTVIIRSKDTKDQLYHGTHKNIMVVNLPEKKTIKLKIGIDTVYLSIGDISETAYTYTIDTESLFITIIKKEYTIDKLVSNLVLYDTIDDIMLNKRFKNNKVDNYKKQFGIKEN